jgi:hypothetical protein
VARTGWLGGPLRRLRRLRLSTRCHQRDEFLSCGSPGLRRRSRGVEPYWLSSPPLLFRPTGLSSVSSGVFRYANYQRRTPGRATPSTASHTLRRHCRVLPQQLVARTPLPFRIPRDLLRRAGREAPNRLAVKPTRRDGFGSSAHTTWRGLAVHASVPSHAHA